MQQPETSGARYTLNTQSFALLSPAARIELPADGSSALILSRLTTRPSRRANSDCRRNIVWKSGLLSRRAGYRCIYCWRSERTADRSFLPPPPALHPSASPYHKRHTYTQDIQALHPNVRHCKDGGPAGRIFLGGKRHKLGVLRHSYLECAQVLLRLNVRSSAAAVDSLHTFVTPARSASSSRVRRAGSSTNHLVCHKHILNHCSCCCYYW